MKRCTHRKKVWVVGRTHPRLTSSVVETSIQVMHNDTNWPATTLRMNLFVQILANRAKRVSRNTDGESNKTLGLEVSSTFVDRVTESTLSSNLDGTGEAGCWLVVVGAVTVFESMVILSEGSNRMDGSPTEKSGTGVSY